MRILSWIKVKEDCVGREMACSITTQGTRQSQVKSWLAAVVCLVALAGWVGGKDRPLSEPASSKIHYQIEIDLDYHQAMFSGREKVSYTNSMREDLDSLEFHLYPNLGLTEEEEPWLVVNRVTLVGLVGSGERELKFSARSRNTTLKVDLPAKLLRGQSIELELEFTARLPRVQREETSLLAHFLQEINDAVSDEREFRDARDLFFAGEESMLLGYFYPIVAARQMQSAEQSLVIGVSGIVFSEIADYQVTVKTEVGVTVISSGEAVAASSPADGKSSRMTYIFRGEKRRGFALAVAERVKSVEQMFNSVKVVSYFREGEERLGKRALTIAVDALNAYSKAFGDYPYRLLQVIEMPLTAGYSGVEFPALITLAQAYYIDFDAPQAARLPAVLREQADLIKSSFEFTLAHGVAHQWWGGVVGSDPERAPYLDEALTTYSAAYYHEVVYGKDLGKVIIGQQLRGTYQAYRMLGGLDQEVDKPSKDFKSALQYSAIVQAKGALLFEALRRELGDEKFFSAIRYYFNTHRFRVASPEHLRYAFLAASDDPRPVRALFQRWLKEKHGDEDIGASDLTLLPPRVSKMRTLGRVFVKIGKTAARPF